MKKISIAAARQTKNFRDHKLTIGLDLGDRSSWYCVLDESGEVLLEQKLATTPKAMKEVFGGMPRSRIALETGTHSPWVSQLLSVLGHEVIVANARRVRLISESSSKDDKLDAQVLARLARIDPQHLGVIARTSVMRYKNTQEQMNQIGRELGVQYVLEGHRCVHGFSAVSRKSSIPRMLQPVARVERSTSGASDE